MVGFFGSSMILLGGRNQTHHQVNFLLQTNKNIQNDHLLEQ